MSVVRPRGQTERSIKREKTLRTPQILCIRIRSCEERVEGSLLVEKDKRRLGERGGGRGGGEEAEARMLTYEAGPHNSL